MIPASVPSSSSRSRTSIHASGSSPKAAAGSSDSSPLRTCLLRTSPRSSTARIARSKSSRGTRTATNPVASPSSIEITELSTSPSNDAATSSTRLIASLTSPTSTPYDAEGGSVRIADGVNNDSESVASETRRSRKFNCPCRRSISDRIRVSSRSIISTSETLRASCSRASRLSSSHTALVSRASRSMNCSVTSCASRFSLSTSPRRRIRSSAVKNSSCGTRIVISAKPSASSPSIERFSTNPPSNSAVS